MGSNQSKYKIPFKEAVQLPVERVVYLMVNGVKTRVKDLWNRYSIPPKPANNKRALMGMSYTQLLDSYGVDTSNIKIVVV